MAIYNSKKKPQKVRIYFFSLKAFLLNIKHADMGDTLRRIHKLREVGPI